MTQATQFTFAPSAGDITVDGTVETRFGKKAVLLGDTYDILSSKGEDLASALDWNDTHCTFDRSVGEWTIDADEVDALEAVLEEHGHELETANWVDEMIVTIRDAVDDDDDTPRYWESYGVEIEVDYKAKTSGNDMTKAGVAYAADDGMLMFKRDDGRKNRIQAGGLYSSGHYPYMGEITEVRATVPGDDAEEDAEEAEA